MVSYITTTRLSVCMSVCPRIDLIRNPWP